MQTLSEQARKLAIGIIQKETRADRLVWLNRSLNMDHKRRICFVHNPKCMGTSIKSWLGLPIDNADHRFPTLLVNKAIWEQYTTVVVVRNPIERFVSSYHFHCRSDYSGGYLQKYPALKSWDMETYFSRMRNAEPYAISPQWKYTVHLRSEHVPTHLIRMETARADLQKLADTLGIEASIPALNRTVGNKESPPPALHEELRHYYRRDLETFGY